MNATTLNEYVRVRPNTFTFHINSRHINSSKKKICRCAVKRTERKSFRNEFGTTSTGSQIIFSLFFFVFNEFESSPKHSKFLHSTASVFRCLVAHQSQVRVVSYGAKRVECGDLLPEHKRFGKKRLDYTLASTIAQHTAEATHTHGEIGIVQCIKPHTFDGHVRDQFT